MSIGVFQLYDSVLQEMVAGSYGNIPTSDFTAVLLTNSYSPDRSGHYRFLDLAVHEASGGDYQRLQLNKLLQDVSPGQVAIKGDDLDWGTFATIPPVRYLAIVQGTTAALDSNSKLFGYVDLNVNGSTVESVNSDFCIKAPASGWFRLQQV